MLNKELIEKARTRAGYLQYGSTTDRAHGNFLKELADALEKAEMRFGHWIIDRAFGNDVMSNEQMVICSACGKGIFWGKQNYCPNCGAKMDDSEENNNEK